MPLLFLCLALPTATEVNLATVAVVTTAPALDGEPDALVDGQLAGKAFVVNSEGPGSVTLSWEQPRRIRRVRAWQGSDIYRMDRLVVETRPSGEGEFETVADLAATPLNAWLEVELPPRAVRAVRFRAVEGKADGKRAYPVFAEVEAWGEPLPGDAALARKLGRPVTTISEVVPAGNRTSLVSDGQAPAILATAAYREAAERLRAALVTRLGCEPVVVETLAAAPLGKATVIALGNMQDNPLLTRLYFGRYTFEDANFPGSDGYTVHTVYDPYPWGGGRDVVVLGVSHPEQSGRAVDRLLASLVGEGAATMLPYTLVVEPSRQLSETARAALLGKPVEPSFTAFRTNAEAYLKSGEEAYARQAAAALETMVGIYAKEPDRKTPWPEETTSGAILAAWDAFEECPLLPAERRAAYTDAFLKLSRDLIKRSYEYQRIPSDDFLITWNHTTFALLGLYFGGRYFARYYDLDDAREWVERARRGFGLQARSWKPQEDADSYLVLTMGHTIEYSLAEWDLAFFESGLIRRYADYVVACGDNRLWPAGFGDSGIHSSASMANAALPYAYWWTKDPGYRWLLDRANPKGYSPPYWPEVEPVEPARHVGLSAFSLDPRLYTYTQRGPTYNEEFVPSEVPVEEAFDKIAFRESWDPADQYLLLDGIGRGKHLHFDTNAIVTFVQDTEQWLLDHDYLTRNTTEHNMLSVLKDGRAGRLVPGLAGLRAKGDLPSLAGTVTYVKNYNGVDWQRRILWRKGGWFLVRDEVTAREPGRYDLELTWKTIDRGKETVTPEGRFVAQRGQIGESRMLLPVDDSAAGNGKAVMLSATGSTLAFGADLPRGDYRVTLQAWGDGTSSDSVWVSIDDQPRVAFHLPKGAYGPSSQVPDHSQPTPTMTVPTDGLHRVEVTLREAPPVRIDRIIFERQGAAAVVEAEAAAPPPVSQTAVASSFSIEPVGVDHGRLTKHVRQGISAPVAIYHQRMGRSLAAGEMVAFASLLHATDARHPHSYRLAAAGDGLYRVRGGAGDALVGLGAKTGEIEADAWLQDEGSFAALGARVVPLGAGRLTVQPAADLELTGETLTVVASTEVTLTPQEVRLGDSEGPMRLPAGKHRLRVGKLAVRLPAATPAAAGQPAAPHEAPAARPPVWSTRLDVAEPVVRLAPADLDGDGQLELLAAAGPAAFCLNADGSVRWRFVTSGLVRDVSVARFTKGGPPSVLVSSADTRLYLLDPEGKELRRQQMTGIYFSADHGERPWGLYLTRAVDRDGDGVDDLVVTTLASMEMWGLDAGLNKLWRYGFTYHGCMDLRFIDLDADGQQEIVAADKYGNVHVVTLDGKKKLSNNTSIGDVAFATADLDGDGRQEIVHGSSTGDLKAIDLAGKELWRFDNYGYPVARIVAAEPRGEGRPELLVASGTGYLYCLDAQGKTLWERRLGFAVHDVVVAGDRILAATADGRVEVMDRQGRPLGAVSVGGEAISLAAWRVGQRSVTVVGSSEGRIAQLP